MVLGNFLRDPFRSQGRHQDWVKRSRKRLRAAAFRSAAPHPGSACRPRQRRPGNQPRRSPPRPSSGRPAGPPASPSPSLLPSSRSGTALFPPAAPAAPTRARPAGAGERARAAGTLQEPTPFPDRHPRSAGGKPRFSGRSGRPHTRGGGQKPALPPRPGAARRGPRPARRLAAAPGPASPRRRGRPRRGPGGTGSDRLPPRSPLTPPPPSLPPPSPAASRRKRRRDAGGRLPPRPGPRLRSVAGGASRWRRRRRGRRTRKNKAGQQWEPQTQIFNAIRPRENSTVTYRHPESAPAAPRARPAAPPGPRSPSPDTEVTKTIRETAELVVKTDREGGRMH